MTNSDYTTIAPEIQQLVDAGEISAEYARNNHSLALILVDFITKIATRPEVAQMFAANDRTHFIEGLQKSAWFQMEFAKYLASFAETKAA